MAQRYIQVKQFMPENKGVLKIWRMNPGPKRVFTQEGVEQRVAALLIEIDEAWPTNGYKLVHVGGLNFNLVWDEERAKENTEKFELEQAAKKLEEMGMPVPVEGQYEGEKIESFSRPPTLAEVESGKTDIQGDSERRSRTEETDGAERAEDQGSIIARGLAGSSTAAEGSDSQDRQSSSADRELGDQPAAVGTDVGGSDGSVEDADHVRVECVAPTEARVPDAGVELA
jgi:hypothetical protein